MKIGIISFWNTTNNYGQVLQCLALQRFLRNLGHDAYHIRFKKRDLKKSEWIVVQFKRMLKTLYYGDIETVVRFLRRKLNHQQSWFTELTLIQSKEDKMHPRRFDDFRERYINFSELEYDQFQIKYNSPEADCYIAGSDQVWSSPSPTYMMQFGQDKVKRIAYAASLGAQKYIDKTKACEFKKHLKKIDVVTCRELSGVEICKKLGRNDAELVPDPTFLLKKNDYEDIAVYPPDQDYLFVYMLGNKCNVNVSEIFDWAKKSNLKVKYVSAQGKIDEFPKLYPNVDEFIGLIMNAKYVITNSFHGMAMSIVLNKSFVVIPLAGNLSQMNDRIDTTLGNLGLSDRKYISSFDEVYKELDFCKVNEILEHQRDIIKTKFTFWLS